MGVRCHVLLGDSDPESWHDYTRAQGQSGKVTRGTASRRSHFTIHYQYELAVEREGRGGLKSKSSLFEK